jgi:hypothetical protein
MRGGASVHMQAPLVRTDKSADGLGVASGYGEGGTTMTD